MRRPGTVITTCPRRKRTACTGESPQGLSHALSTTPFIPRLSSCHITKYPPSHIIIALRRKHPSLPYGEKPQQQSAKQKGSSIPLEVRKEGRGLSWDFFFALCSLPFFFSFFSKYHKIASVKEKAKGTFIFSVVKNFTFFFFVLTSLPSFLHDATAVETLLEKEFR